MNELMKIADGKKTWMGLIALAVLAFVVDIGWSTPEQLGTYNHLAEYLFAGGVFHKVDKWVTSWLKGKK